MGRGTCSSGARGAPSELHETTSGSARDQQSKTRVQRSEHPTPRVRAVGLGSGGLRASTLDWLRAEGRHCSLTTPHKRRRGVRASNVGIDTRYRARRGQMRANRPSLIEWRSARRAPAAASSARGERARDGGCRAPGGCHSVRSCSEAGRGDPSALEADGVDGGRGASPRDQRAPMPPPLAHRLSEKLTTELHAPA